MPKVTTQELLDKTMGVVMSLRKAVDSLEILQDQSTDGKTSTKKGKKKRGSAKDDPEEGMKKFFKEQSKDTKEESKDRKKDRLEQKKEGRGAFKEMELQNIGAVSNEGSGSIGFLKWFKSITGKLGDMFAPEPDQKDSKVETVS